MDDELKDLLGVKDFPVGADTALSCLAWQDHWDNEYVTVQQNYQQRVRVLELTTEQAKALITALQAAVDCPDKPVWD